MRILEFDNQDGLIKAMQDIGVDPYGIRLMAPKGIWHLIKINSVSNISANILKQEMLSLGADVAVAKGALTGKSRKTDCLLIGNLSQFRCLQDKLVRQPFGLAALGRDLGLTLENYIRDNFRIELGSYVLRLAKRTRIMGIVNLTPDSFSGDGLYSQEPRAKSQEQRAKSKEQRAKSKEQWIDFVEKMIEDGADIIDVGGESSRPGSRGVPLKEELSRVIPVIKILAKKLKAPISVDTRKSEVAQAALDNGAVMVNDITGLRDRKMVRVVARYKAAVVIMHMKGSPGSMQNNPMYGSLLDEILGYLLKAMRRATEAGIAKEKIIIDPGIGFGKTTQHNLEILNRLREFKVLGRPILIGPSRKSFIGKILNTLPQKRIFGSISACVLAARSGAHIVRAHDVKAVQQALKVADSINQA